MRVKAITYKVYLFFVYQLKIVKNLNHSALRTLVAVICDISERPK